MIFGKRGGNKKKCDVTNRDSAICSVAPNGGGEKKNPDLKVQVLPGMMASAAHSVTTAPYFLPQMLVEIGVVARLRSRGSGRRLFGKHLHSPHILRCITSSHHKVHF